AEKHAASELAKRLAERARLLANEAPEPLQRLLGAFDWAALFAKQFELATQATFYAARAGDGDAAKVQRLSDNLLELAEEAEGLLANEDDLPHHHAVLFDPEQIRRFARSLAE
ncbi:MAG: hypothetical protein AAF401_15050, partial [Pseudomonadota bacterium]